MTTRLSAFVGRSFLDEDKGIWHELRDILDSLKSMGFVYEDAREGQIRPISEKVKEIIMRHEIYIGVMTKRFPIWHLPSSWQERWLFRRGSYVPQKWSTSEWVIEEVGFAIGRDKKILLLIEDGVNFPTSDLDGDTQWIQFKRDKMAASQSDISEMILNLISQRVISIAEPASLATLPPANQDIENNKKPSFLVQIKTIKDLVLRGEFAKADRVQDEILSEKSSDENDTFMECFLLSLRARHNDSEALNRLKQMSLDNPSNHHAILSLSEVLSSFGQFSEATNLLLSHQDKVTPSKRNLLVIGAAMELCKDDKATEAIALLLERVKMECDEVELGSLYRELANAAEKAKNADLELAFLEKYLKLVPFDSDARFHLAFKYSNNEQDQVAAYHYQQVIKHTNWPSASNNLGVTYRQLGFKANQHMIFKSVADKYPLAKSNLADLYATSGALAEAEELAKSVLAISEGSVDIQLALDRARYVLGEIETTKKTEKEGIDRIAGDTKDERDFMCAYAEAYCLPSLARDKAIFATVHGDIEIVRELSSLKGEGSVIKSTLRGGLNSLAAFSTGLLSSEGEVSTYLLSLSAQLNGQSGIFELTISPKEKSRTILGDSSRIINGLMYFKSSGDVIQFFERDEKNLRVVSARRKL